jgi:hypothetical protein
VRERPGAGGEKHHLPYSFRIAEGLASSATEEDDEEEDNDVEEGGREGSKDARALGRRMGWIQHTGSGG